MRGALLRAGANPSSASSYPRPVPVIGDQTSAAERGIDPTGWAMGESVQQALAEVIGARRDIRRYRPDGVPPEVLQQVLAAAHAAPSVGHSQPWRFIVVRDRGLRDRAALMADRERLRQAEQLGPERGRRLLDLQLEGIREAPLGIVVACDRRSPAAGVLGRATFVDTDLWSCACAIENLWLAARAQGLGVGWVTLFQPQDLAELIQLPPGVETLGWLCLGWPDERPPDPGLERAGWSKRTPLADVVFQDRWPAEDAPAPPSHLAGPDAAEVVAVRDHADARLSPVESLGVLDRYVDKILALPGSEKARDGGTLVFVAAQHPVAGLGVSAYPASVTDQVWRATLAGQSLGAVAAEGNGLALAPVDVRVSTLGGRGDLRHQDALSLAEAQELIALGRQQGELAAATGIIALGEVGVGNTTVAAALAAALLDLPAEQSVGLGAGSDADIISVKIEVVQAALNRLSGKQSGQILAPLTILTTLGGADAAVLTGVVLGAASHGAPVVLDGLLTSVAALLAVRLEPATARFLIAGHRSRESVHAQVLAELGLEPLLDLRFRSGEGVGAALAAGLLKQGITLRERTARTQ